MNKSSNWCSGTWPQWLAAFQVFLMAVMMGLVTGWTSPYLAKMTKPNSSFPITTEEASWFASLINISRPAGAVFGAIFTSFMGSKLATLFIGVPYALGWSCFLIATSVPSFYVSRVLSGIGIGMFYSSFPLYIGEISDPKIRGALICTVMQGLLMGNLLGNIMGAYLNTWIYATICLVPNLFYLAAFLWMPDTPHFLVSRNRLDAAAKSIEFYHRNCDTTAELESLKKFMQTNQQLKVCDILRSFNTPVNRKAIWIVNIVFICVQLSGLFTVNAYLEIMFSNARVTVIKPSLLVIIVSVLSILSSWMGIYTNDKFGRTIMLIISALGVAISMFLWGLNYLLLDLHYDNADFQWISIVAAIVYQITMAIGLMPVPTTLMSEMFAPQIKSVAACITNITSALFAFAASRSYQPMVDALTAKYVFWIYGILMIVLAVYTKLFIPETKGKTLAEIQNILTYDLKKKKTISHDNEMEKSVENC